MVPGELARESDAFATLAPLNIPFKGTVAFTLDLDGVPSRVSFDLEGGDGHVDFPEYFDEPIGVELVRLQGSFDDGLERVRLESASLDLGGPQIRSSGSFSWGDPGVGIEAIGSIENLSMAELKSLWPAVAGASAREWTRGHILDGLIPTARFSVNIAPGAMAGAGLPDEAVSLDFSFQDLTTVYYAPLPPLTNSVGTAHLGAKVFDLAVSRASLAGLSVSEGRVYISGLDQEKQFGDISLVVTGPTSEIMAVLDLEPLGYARDVGLDPATVGGMSATRMQFRLPLRNDLLTREIQYSAASNLSDAAIPGLFGSYDLSDGTLALKIDGNSAHVAGKAALNGAPVQLTWQRFFKPTDDLRTRISLSGTFDDAQREALLLPLDAYLDGRLGMALQISENTQARHSANVSLALVETQIVIPELRWQKRAGVNGAARLGLREVDDGFIIDSFALAAGDLAAEGRIRLDEDWALRALDLNRLAFGGPDGTEVSLALRPRDDGGYDLAVQGARFDMRPYLDDADERERDDSAAPLAVSAHLGHVMLEDGQDLTDVKATAFNVGDRWTSAEMTGALVDAGPFELRLTPNEDKRDLTVTAADAGLVARALGLFESARGGTLSVKAAIRDDLPGRPIEGHVKVEKFRLVEAPLLARILGLASLTGMDDLLKGEGISFEQLAAPFTMADGKVTLTEARAYGSAFGIMADGVVDRGAGTADLKGTIAPSYTLNTLPGKIPILGELLVGKEGEGLFALTYTVKGPLDNPRIVVNPLAALAPGFLRRMFFLGEPAEGVRDLGDDEGPG
jgi:uncharacterized protein YhdP